MPKKIRNPALCKLRVRYPDAEWNSRWLLLGNQWRRGATAYIPGFGRSGMIAYEGPTVKVRSKA